MYLLILVGCCRSVLLDDERFPDAAVVCLEASVDNIVTAIQKLNLTKIGKLSPCTRDLLF